MKPDCCDTGRDKIQWMKADEIFGPELPGWSIVDGMADYGLAYIYINIAYCPWCGRKLNPPPPSPPG